MMTQAIFVPVHIQVLWSICKARMVLTSVAIHIWIHRLRGAPYNKKISTGYTYILEIYIYLVELSQAMSECLIGELFHQGYPKPHQFTLVCLTSRALETGNRHV
jgi:hypothetical protein